MEVPYGFCHCGCGNQTTLAKINDPKRGIVKGQRNKFLNHHHTPEPRESNADAMPFKIDGVYCRFIPLTQRQIAIVWAEDYARASIYRWYARWDERARGFYASRKARKGESYKDCNLHTMLMDRDEQVDHVNRITLDDRRSNLRKANQFEQRWNQEHLRNSASKMKGVFFDNRSGKWRASIQANGKRHWIGTFHSFDDARSAYIRASVELHGEFSPFFIRPEPSSVDPLQR